MAEFESNVANILRIRRMKNWGLKLSKYRAGRL